MRLLLSAALLASVVSLPSHAEDVSGLLYWQTQAFSDAGQQGEGSVMAKYLDNDVVFFNEVGDSATKADLSQNGPPGQGTTPKVFQRDANGRITGFIYLHGNHSLTFKRKAAA